MFLSVIKTSQEKETQFLPIGIKTMIVATSPAGLPLSYRRRVGAKTSKLLVGLFVVLLLMRNPLDLLHSLILIYFTGWSRSDYQFADIYLQYSARRLDFWIAFNTICTLPGINKAHRQAVSLTKSRWIETCWNEQMAIDKLYFYLTANAITAKLTHQI